MVTKYQMSYLINSDKKPCLLEAGETLSKEFRGLFGLISRAASTERPHMNPPDGVMSFIYNCVLFDKGKRYTAEEALKDDFFKSHSPVEQYLCRPFCSQLAKIGT